MVTADGLRIVFFGTPPFAVPTLDHLLASPHVVAGVVTQPDRPRGRGHRTVPGAVKARALAAGLAVLQPAALKDPAFLSALSALDADVGIVAAYGKILSEAVLAIPRLGLLNVHASLLPRYRGAAPVHRAVIAGERETGVTIMRVVKALDAGPMLSSIRRPILRDETSEDLERDLARLGAELLLSTLERCLDGSVRETPQAESDATYAPRLTKEDGRIDWSLSAQNIHDVVRGLHPWPHAYTFWNERRIILLRVDAMPSPPGAAPDAPPGTVLAAHGDDLVVQAAQGIVAVRQLQGEGTRSMTPRDFLAGHRVTAGDHFIAGP